MAGTNPIVGDVLQARVITRALSQIGMNIYHYLVTTAAPPNPSLLDIADAIDNLVAIPYKNLLSNLATYRGVGVTNLMSPRTQEYSSVTRAGAGTAGADLLPTQTRGLLSFYTGLAGPKMRGRAYVPFPPATANTNVAEPTAGYVTFLSGLLTAISTPITVTSGAGSCTLKLIILHKSGTFPNYNQVSFVFARTKWATQRRSGAYGRVNTTPF